MAGNAWHKRYSSNALQGYAHLSLEERGFYNTILDLLYDTDWEDGLIENERVMAAEMKCSTRLYRTIRDRLIETGKIIRLPSGRLSNPRYLKEREKAQRLSEKRAEAGQKGGQAKAAQAELFDPQNSVQPEVSPTFSPKKSQNFKSNAHSTSDEHSEFINENNDSDLANAKQLLSYTRATQRPEDRKNKNLSLSTTESLTRATLDPAAIADQLCRIAGVRNLEPSRIIANCNTVREWIGDGINLAGIEHAIIAARDRGPRNIHSLSYFDAAVRRAHAQQEHPNHEPASDFENIRDSLLRKYLESGGALED